MAKLSGSSKLSTVKSGGLTKASNINTDLKMNYGAGADKLMPPEIIKMMQAQFKAVGLDFDPGAIKLTDKNANQKIKQLKETIEIIVQNVQILPDMVALCAKASQGAKKLSDAQREMVINTLKAQHGIDINQAEILLAYAKFGKARNAIQEKLEAEIQMVRNADQSRFTLAGSTYDRQLQALQQNAGMMQAIQDRRSESTKRIQESKQKKRQATIDYVEVSKL